MPKDPPISTMTYQQHLASPENDYVRELVADWVAKHPENGMRRMQETLELMGFSMRIVLDGPEETAKVYSALSEHATFMKSPEGTA